MIVWLASYPKSGNTWLRLLLENYFSDSSAPISINALSRTRNGASRTLLDSLLGLKTSKFHQNEIPSLRAVAYREYARRAKSTVFLKIHDRCSVVKGEPLFPKEITQAVIYIVRDPRDVVVSYAHHRNCSLDDATEVLNDSNHGLFEYIHGGQVYQHLGSWSQHVESWLDSELPLVLMRYEQLHTQTGESLERLLNFVGIVPCLDRVEHAVRCSSFALLKAQESENEFSERSFKSSHFFRGGRIGDGKKDLSPNNLKAIESHHQNVMKSLGYL